MPTVDEVKEAGNKLDESSAPGEWLLQKLFQEQFPSNDKFYQVLLKTKVLNLLYSTRILDVNTVARHIIGLGNLDSEIASGSPDAVRLIANVQIKDRTFCFYSFATKYCSFHNPTTYPIYDSNVDACLWFYKKQDAFAKFARQDLWHYPKFLEVVTAFRRHYGLDSFSFKELDNYLYCRGEELIAEKQNSRKEREESAAETVI